MFPAFRLIAALALLLAPVVAAPAAERAATPAAERAAEPGTVLVLGRVSDNPKEDYARLRPMLDYVVPKMAGVGIREGRILMARDTQQMLSYLRRGRVDWLSETAGASVTYQERAGARLLLLTERGGLSTYQAVFFARADSGIRSLADLRGRAIAFQNAASTSSYFLPAAEILGAGVPLVVLASPSDRPSAEYAGFVFARSELNISTWVHKGLVDAGAYGEHDWLDLDSTPDAFRGDLVVFHRSPAVPRAMEVVRGDLDPRVAARLREVLLAAPDDPAALPGLRAMWNTTRYRPVDADAAQALAEFQRGVARIRAEVE
jgi:phosphonate transport system substrate-binding protein